MFFKKPIIRLNLAVWAAMCVLWVGAGSNGSSVTRAWAAESYKPGLAVEYFTDKFIRHLDKFPKGSGKPGKPIRQVNHRFGKDQVFGSGQNRGVCVKMTGYIRLDKAGQYEFRAMSNDGIRVYVDGKMVVNDPDVHSDRLSQPRSYNAATPGWKSFQAKYFQRKGTARLEFHWKPPGASGFTPIPAEAYGH